MNLKPYRKAIIAGAFSAIAVAAGYYDVGWLQALAAFAAPIGVYFARNEL